MRRCPRTGGEQDLVKTTALTRTVLNRYLLRRVLCPATNSETYEARSTDRLLPPAIPEMSLRAYRAVANIRQLSIALLPLLRVQTLVRINFANENAIA